MEILGELVRPRSEYMDSMLGVKIPVLDDGFVRVIDYLGDEAAIAQAARTSYGKGTKSFREDIGLIRYLMRKHHTGPFEQCELKLHVRVPMDCWRQWIRHRMASVNEYSTRYSEAIDSRQRTAPDQWRAQSKSNKQGSGGFLDEKVGEYLTRSEADLHTAIWLEYQERLDRGVAREQARKDLPLSTYTEAYWKIDVHNLLHFLALRLDSHAQLEIRTYAGAIGNILSQWMPNVWNAFEDFRLHSLTLSAKEVELIKLIPAGSYAIRSVAEAWGWFGDPGLAKDSPKMSGECMEAVEKFTRLGLPTAWSDVAAF